MPKYDFDLTSDRKKKKRHKKEFRSVLFLLLETLFTIGLAFALVTFCLKQTKMPEASMSPTIESGTTTLVNTKAYFRNGPKRFDVIAFTTGDEDHEFCYIKRVIGLPGEKVQIKEGIVYINDTALEEVVNIKETMNLYGLAQNPIFLGEDEYFVLGDNRNNSEDSRFANIGNVSRGQIVGKVWMTFDPIHFVKHLNQKKK